MADPKGKGKGKVNPFPLLESPGPPVQPQQAFNAPVPVDDWGEAAGEGDRKDSRANGHTGDFSLYK